MKYIIVLFLLCIQLFAKCTDGNITFNPYSYFGGVYFDLDIKDNRAFVTSEKGLEVIDVSDVSKLARLAKYEDNKTIAVVVDGNYTYTATSNFVNVFDVSFEQNISKIFSLEFTSEIYDLAIQGQQLYIATDDGLSIYDKSVPTALVSLGSYQTATKATKVIVDTNLTYLLEEYKGLSIVDTSVPSSPQKVSYFDAEGYTFDIFLDGNYTYFAIGSNPSTMEGVIIVDTSDTSDPTLVGEYYDVATLKDARSIYVLNETLYVTDDFNGLVTLDISNKATPNYVSTESFFGYVYEMIYKDGYFYLLNSLEGLLVYENNTSQINLTDTLFTSAETTSITTVSDKYAYVTDHFNGFFIFDISDISNIAMLSQVATQGYAKKSIVNGDIAYVVDDTDGYKEQYGLNIFNITDKKNPILLSKVATSGNAKDVAVSGDFAYVADWANGLVVVDISDKSQPKIVNTYQSGGFVKRVEVKDYTLYLADTENGLIILDITEPSNPAFISVYDTEGTLQDLSVHDGRVYVVDGFEGLLSLDTTDLSAISLIAQNKTDGFFNGVYSNANKIIASVKDDGLYAYDTSENNTTFLNKISIEGDFFDITMSANFALIANGSKGLKAIELCGYMSVSELISYGKQLCVDDPSVCGITASTAFTKENIDAKTSGWYLLGASSAIEDLSIFDDVKTVWKYDKTNGWYAYSKDANTSQTLQNSGVDILQKIEQNEGFWINR